MARIKGSGLIHAVKSLRTYGGGKTHLPPRLRKYLTERILPSSWFPEEDHLEIIRALGKVLPRVLEDSKEDVYVSMGRAAAKQDLATIYASSVRPGDVLGTLTYGVAMWRTYHDTGSLTVTSAGPNHICLELVGYELPSTEMCRITLGWTTEWVKKAGAKDIRMRELQCCANGAKSCVWDIDWK